MSLHVTTFKDSPRAAGTRPGSFRTAFCESPPSRYSMTSIESSGSRPGGAGPLQRATAGARGVRAWPCSALMLMIRRRAAVVTSID